MSATLNLGTDGQWATKENSLLGYNSENGNYKPLPFDFTRASNGTFVNKSGLIETAANGVPRIDFSDSTSGALLLEPQRTNLITYSSDFSQWSGSGYITSNYAISPDGTQNATRCLFTGANQVLSKTSTLPTGVSCSATFYVKGVSGETIRLAAGGADTTHLLNGSWQRIETNSTSINSTIVLNTFGGATARDLLIYGAQLELGSYATSLINTQGSAVTRVADLCNNGGNEQVINSNEGVFYAEISALYNDGGNRIISLNDGSQVSRVIIFYTTTNNEIRVISSTNSINQFDRTFIVSDVKSFFKIAIKYKNNDFSFWVNGIEVGTGTNGLAPIGLSKLSFDNGSGGANFYGNVKDIRVYNTALTDQELIALTS
jgi:hypothetical protein